MRKEFSIPEDDNDFLESSGYKWEAIVCNGNWIFIHEYPIPSGYNVQSASIALKLNPGYPTSQIDMVYFNPSLSRSDGKQIGALAFAKIDNESWQRWSRHRTRSNPWRPGLDNIATHLSLVDYWLQREFKLR